MLVALVLVVAAALAMQTRAFHRFVLAKITSAASTATGGRVDIGSYRFLWSGLELEFNDIVLHGAEPPSSAPLLHVDHVLVGLRILSLWRRQMELQEVIVDQPAIHLTVDKNGNTNLPHPSPAGARGGSTNVFDLAIGHAVVTQGDLDWNDRHIPLDAELRGFHADINFHPATTEYDGSLGYVDGRIRLGSFNPVQQSVELRFGATPAGLTLDSATVKAGASVISLTGRLEDYGRPQISGSYQASLSTTELGRILRTASLPEGQVDIRGTVLYASRPTRTLLNNLTLLGQFHSAVLAIRSPQLRARVRALNGEFRMSDGTLEARNLRAGLWGGSVNGSVTIADLSQEPTGKLSAALHGVSLDALSAAAGANQFQRAAITGTLNGTVQGTWKGSGENLRLRSDATITASAPVADAAAPAHPAIPLHGTLHVAYGSRGGISLHDSELATSHSMVTLNGSMGEHSNLSIRAQSDDLAEVDQLALIARKFASGNSSTTVIQPFGISGEAAFNGQLGGSMSRPELTGFLSGTNVKYQGTTLASVRTNLAVSPRNVALSQGELQTDNQGRMEFNVSAGLQDWSYTAQSPIRVELTAEQLRVATLERLASLHDPVTGLLTAQLSMQGTQSDLTGRGSAALTQAMGWNQPIQKLSGQFQAAGTRISSKLDLLTSAGSASGQVTYDFRTQAFSTHISLPGLQLGKLAALSQVKVPVTGVITASLEGSGTLKDPQLSAMVQAPKLSIERQDLTGLKLVATVAQRHAILTVNAAADGASIQARANVSLEADYTATASLDIGNIHLAEILASYFPQTEPGLSGEAELHASLRGPLKQPRQIEGEIEIPSLNLAYQSLKIGNASPVHAIYRGGVLTVQPCAFKGSGTNLQIQATVPLESAGGLQAKAAGDVDLHLLQLFYPDWNSSGRVNLSLEASGALRHPDVQGSVRVMDAALQPPGAPLGVQKLNAALALQNGRLDIQNLTAEAGGGTLSAQGFAAFQPVVQLNLRLNANHVRLRYPVGTRTLLNSTLVLTGSRASALLSGQVTIDRLSLTPEFDLATFADQFSGSSQVSSGQSFAQDIKLNVSLRSASVMAVANSQMSIQGSANLIVRGTAANPVILGRTDITDGEIFFNGQRYTVQSGVISFVNPVETEPVVNVHVAATIEQFDITINFEGPIDRMRTTYTSQPPLAPVDIINLIATGQTTEASALSPTTPQSVIAGQLASQVSSRVQKLAGISSLTIDPQVGSGQGNGIARVGVRERVTKNLYFSFSTDLANTADQTIQVEYQVSKRFAVSTMRDQNGIYTFQVKMHKSF